MPDWAQYVRQNLRLSGLEAERETEVIEDLAEQLEDAYAEALQRGLSPSQAEAAAKKHIADWPALANEVGRSRRGRESTMNALQNRAENRNIAKHGEFSLFTGLMQDMHYALRMLRKSPGFAALAVLTLALGIGANAAIFSMVDWLILRMPPVAAPQQVVTLAAAEVNGYSNGFSYPDFLDIRSQSSAVFSEVAAATNFQMDGFSIDGESEPIWCGYVTGNFFPLMGVRPALGQFIEPTSETHPNDEPILVLSYSFWKAHLGADPRVIGKSALINGHPVTIIGVAPKGFHGVGSFLDTQGYLPLGLAAVTADANKDFATNRKDSVGVMIIARLKTGVTAIGAQPALKVIAQRLSAQYPATDKWTTLIAYPFGPMSPTSDPQTPHTVWLMGGLFLMLAGLVLLLACLNVANLLLVRALARQREMAVRAAVGGGRSRLIRQLLTESLLLALIGCAAGIGLGLIASRSLSAVNLEAGLPVMLDFQFDWRVFSYAFGAALLTAIIVGIAPALRATRGDLNNLLHQSARTATAGHRRTRGLLVVAQVGGSLMLLIIAGLFVRSLHRVQHANLGFDPSNVVNFAMDPHQSGYNEAQSSEFLNTMLQRVRALPGAETASLAATVPLGPTYFGMRLRIDGYQPPKGQDAPSAGYNAISPQYFQTMRIPLLRGRGFLDSDSPNSPYVAVVNETMADKYWHGKDALGRHFVSTDDPKHSIEVVGVVENSRYGAPYGPYEPYIFVPLAQHYDYQQQVTLQLRTNLPLASTNREVVGAIHSLAPAMPVFDIQTMTEALGGVNGFMLFRIGAGLAASLGLMGLALAVVGVYGVVSYGASQRTHEIGIRKALGARPAQVLKMIFRQAIFIIGAGIALGVLAAACIARLVGSFLVDVSSLDAITYGSAVLIIAAVALVACYIPARRAMRVDPMVALRYE
jgi:predicted permease